MSQPQSSPQAPAPQAAGQGRALAVVGGKGGVGKSVFLQTLHLLFVSLIEKFL